MPRNSTSTDPIGRLRALGQRALPHRALSNIIRRASHSTRPLVKNTLIRGFMAAYDIDLGEAEHLSPREYPTFNAFFTRALMDGARNQPAERTAVASPVDGYISEIGTLVGDRILQAKGHRYTALELLGGDEKLADVFTNGHFATIYLSPSDYHRVHMPVAGELRGMTYLPGSLFSVAPHTVRHIPDLFARNERLVTLFASTAGAMGLVMVGAVGVGGIETVWEGEITPPHGSEARRWNYRSKRPRFERGAELGRFNMGSTVVLLFPPGRVEWDPRLAAGDRVLMGEAIGRVRR